MLGTPASSNFPGPRLDANSWVDASGNLWLAGGFGIDSPGNLSYLNDLWEFDLFTQQWTWIGGSKYACTGAQSLGKPVCDVPGQYGTQGTPGPDNAPGAREFSATWAGSDGNLWLFAGDGVGEIGSTGYLDDLWKLNTSTNEWTWVGGKPKANLPAVYGSLGATNPSYTPGGISHPATSTDLNGNFWLFGGVASGASSNVNRPNQLWEFNPVTSEWTWMTGSVTPPTNCVNGSCGFPGVYGAIGVPTFENNPGGRATSQSWTDAYGNFWIFGGYGFDSAGALGYLNDLWVYETQTDPPVIKPNGGAFTAPQTVTITDYRTNSAIYYTTNGKTPTTASTLYTAPFTLSKTTTLQAIAIAPGFSASAVVENIYSITTPQVLHFENLSGPVTYGAPSIPLKAAASSGLPVEFTVVSGPGKISGTTLAVTGAGTIVVQARQPGNAIYAPATSISHNLIVEKAKLTATPRNLTLKHGASVPPLTYTLVGLVNHDSPSKATSGQLHLSTRATAASKPGKYPITVAASSLVASNYKVAYATGTLTVIK